MNPIKFFIFCTIILLSHGLQGQGTKNVNVVFQNKKISHQVFNGFYEYLQDNTKEFTFENKGKKSTISIIPAVRTSGIKTIEGIENKKVGKGNLSILINNEATGKDSTISRSYSVIAQDERALHQEILQKINSDQTLIVEINSVLSHLYKDHHGCSSLYTIVANYEDKNDIQQALTTLLKLENTYAECQSEWQKQKNALIEKYEKITCENILYEAEILANSGVSLQMNKAVNLLLKIPPTAQCRSEALRIAKELSERNQISKINAQKLIQYNNIQVKDFDWLLFLESIQ